MSKVTCLLKRTRNTFWKQPNTNNKKQRLIKAKLLERMRQKQIASHVLEKLRKHDYLVKVRSEKRKSELELQEKKEEQRIKQAKERKQEQIENKIREWNEKLRFKSRSPSIVMREPSKILSERSVHAKIVKDSLNKKQEHLLDEKLNLIALKRMMMIITQIESEKEKKRLKYIESMTATAKSENEAARRKLKEVEEIRRRKSYESLLSAQKRVKEYERHRDLHQMRKNEIREMLLKRQQKKKERFEKNWSLILEKEKQKIARHIEKEEEYQECIKQRNEYKLNKKAIKEELKKMKGEGITENLERLKRIKVFSQTRLQKYVVAKSDRSWRKEQNAE
eukprot:TRINITY_DN121394_c0_g1_i1.p2 TRINITY_DN121394_c0_g1~~TRINITY_DN121394_c0_g1_i1.p2  ORF type:complete len:336 (-),score=48.12 TRINITY_DN121394_c0_g1_i1:1365-2372(-)